MRLKLYFTKSTTVFNDGRLYDCTLSFLHKILGEDNKYHSSFSQYSITHPLGYEVVKDGITFPKGSHLYINSNDAEFLEDVMSGIVHIKNLTIGDMRFQGMETDEYKINSNFDYIKTITPILMKSKKTDRFITYEDDSDYFNLLEEQSKNKLLHLGFEKGRVDKLRLIPMDLENSKVKVIKFKKACLPASKLSFIVEGDKELRKNLYEMGFGNLTGCGFGYIGVYNNRNHK